MKKWTHIRDDQDGEEDGLHEFLWLIRKESPKSRRKIDLAMAACLSWEARGDALRSGALNEKVFARAQW